MKFTIFMGIKKITVFWCFCTFFIFGSLLLTGCANQDENAQAVISFSENTRNTLFFEQTDRYFAEKERLEQEWKAARDLAPAVKGIYVTGPMAGHEKMADLITLVEETELNAMVIDIKNDEGIVTAELDNAMVQEIGAVKKYIPDLKGLVRQLKDKGIYTIARIVAFKDPLLAEHYPELCMKTADGQIFRDKKGLAWVNPYETGVWEYLIGIAEDAAKAGFDEIQFDYIRFPTDITEQVDFGEDAVEKSRTDVITEFTSYAYEKLKPLGVMVSADVYGTIIDNETDAQIVGQDYNAMASQLDYICPMIYPSHYKNGVYGIADPDLLPYETVFAALQASREALGEEQAKEEEAQEQPRAKVRAWLQDFTATWIHPHKSYGKEEIRAQIQAVYDSGYEEWILWNAKCSYTRDGLLSLEEADAKEGND